MATYEKGDMWEMWGRTSLFLITTNSTINWGGLVMGRGIAKEAVARLQGIRLMASNLINDPSGNNHKPNYGLLTFDYRFDQRIANQHIGLFQVKNHFKEKASISLIKLSTAKLFWWILNNGMVENPTGFRVDLNFPGIGNGALTKAEVKPIMDMLPDCIHIWEYEKSQQMSMMDVYSP